MIKEGCIIVLAVCCIFSVIPLVGVFYTNPLGFFLPAGFLLVVLSYAGYYVKKLIDTGEHNLVKGFILSLIVAMMLSMIAVYFILPFVLPKVVL